MVDFLVEKRAKGRAGAGRIIAVENYVRLSNGSEKVFVQKGVVQWEDGTPLTEAERASWTGHLEGLSRATQVACGLVSPSAEAQRAPEVPAVWVFGPTDSEDVYIRSGVFYSAAGQVLEHDDVPLWVHSKLAVMDNRERLRAGLMPVNRHQKQEDAPRMETSPEAAPERPPVRDASVAMIECPQCGERIDEAAFDAHCDVCQE